MSKAAALPPPTADSDSVLLRRLIALRHVPAFADAELDELAALADNAVETVVAAGGKIAVAGEPVPYLHLVLDGRLEATGADPREWGKHEVFGTLEVLTGRAAGSTVIAAVPTRTLRLSAEAMADLLEDNVGILVAMTRELARAMASRPAARWPRNEVELPASPEGGQALGLVERLILLRQQPLFAHGQLQALSMLAQLATERTWLAGEAVTTAGTLADELVLIVAGTVRRDGDADADGKCDPAYGAGDAVGFIETLAAVAHPCSLVAATEVRALTAHAAAVFDVLEDHTGLGLAMLASMASVLLDEPPA